MDPASWSAFALDAARVMRRTRNSIAVI